MAGPTHYRIVLRAELSDRYRLAFEPMALERVDGRTILSGEVADQAELHSLLERTAQLGIELISIEPSDETR